MREQDATQRGQEERAMSDEADMSQAAEEMILAAARLRRRPTLPFCGRCYNCDEPLERGLFCDQDCRSDYERRTR